MKNNIFIFFIINLLLFSFYTAKSQKDTIINVINNNNSFFVHINLLNMQGVLMKNYLELPQQEPGIYYCNFSLSNLPSGLYMLVFKNASKTVSSKIIKH
ncbi:MAG: T9SS type A sorting domain-containing protein [Bacteroidales bacterium]|nr:T9SS type A sorting domain-containing protein [Bacteroidales bacterium]